MENKDIKVVLQYNLDEVNHLLTLLGALPFNQSAMAIESIRLQVIPQLPVASENANDAKAGSEGDQQAGVSS
jgi:hypothetical protein